ncbi:MAG: hypothetical protein ACPLTR_08390 [Thermacetogeniaceae bacterium]
MLTPIPQVPVEKKLELLAWELKQTGNPGEQIDILRTAYHIGGKEAILVIAAQTGYSFEQLWQIGKLWKVHKERNRIRRGKGTGEGKLRRERELAAEAYELACQEAGFLGVARRARRNALSKTTVRKAARSR